MLYSLRSRLSIRLTVLFLVGSLTPILGAGAISLGLIEDSVRRDADRRQRMLVALCGALFEDYVDSAQEKLTTVARLVKDDIAGVSDDNRAYRNALVSTLDGLVEPPDLFLELQYFGGGPKPELVSQLRQRGFDKAQRAGADYAARNDMQVLMNLNSAVVLDPAVEGTNWRSSQLESLEGYQTLALSVPVREPEGTRGALVAYLDFALLHSRLEKVAGTEFVVAIADGDGTELARAGTVEGRRIERSQELNEAGWTIEIAESADELDRAVASVRRQAWLWTAVAVLLAFVLSVGFSAWITRPIGKLRRAAERMEAGDLKARAGIDRHDEIGQLGRAFDRMASALDQLDEAKSEFVANVSHELRTPLTSMRLSVANLAEGVLGPLDERQTKAIVRVRRELDRMSALVDELLEMARLEAGVVEPRREPLDLADLARDALEAVRELARERGVAILLQGEGAAVGDHGIVRRILVNLLDNAIKFSPEGGEVRVGIEAGRLRVADNGPGLDTERLFEKFRQGDQDGVKHRGVGLGLAIVKKLVELSGGTIRAESHNGAVFVLELPSAEDAGA